MTTRPDAHRGPGAARSLDAAMLEVRGLSVVASSDGAPVELVSDISFTLHAGRTLALVGESGCGKTVTALSLLRLLPRRTLRIASGAIVLRPRDPKQEAVDVARLPDRALADVRGRRIGMIFQEPMTSLHPLKTIGEQASEGVRRHLGAGSGAARERVERWLSRVGLEPAKACAKHYPHELSGGMRQRATIAAALACEPDVLVADEPTTALDASVQAQVLRLLRDVQREAGPAILLITHDFGVVAEAADDVAVMYAGRIVERGPAFSVMSHPCHPYTRALLECVPRPNAACAGRLRTIPGRVPVAAAYPAGCRFHPRCAIARGWAESSGSLSGGVEIEPGVRVLPRCIFGDAAAEERPHAPSPPWISVGPGHEAACWEIGAGALDQTSDSAEYKVRADSAG
ncbi:MAG: Vitamin B12 import ATP-binding protein BtuD [Phycisphaerae bacterium]|nr:Vitamin B12 import ATP-binding protein BtuD [Phycisphaerae bacterium]